MEIQREINRLKSSLGDANEFERMRVQSQLYELEQKRKDALAEEARRKYQEAGWF
jgi:hypothetical protein